MFKKVKKFYEEHKTIVSYVGGGIVILTAGVLLNKKLKSNTLEEITGTSVMYDDSKDRAILESYGAVFKDGINIPFATKDVATKFMEERGGTYQLGILDDLSSVIWISEWGVNPSFFLPTRKIHPL